MTKRVTQEFDELFETRYRERFGGEGITLKVSKRPAWHTYRPASGGLQEVRVQVPNPLGIASQFKALPEIWNSCIADLRRLSRVSGTQESGAVTVEAWEAMPPELRADVDHPLTEKVTRLVSENVGSAGTDKTEDRAIETAMVPAGRFAELVGIERRPTLTAVQSRRVATIIESTGYGLVPDARISQIRYGWDDLVAVVPGLDDDDVESARYNAAACVLRLGLAIALADGEVDEVEMRMLTDHIDSVFGLTTPEQIRITALRKLLLTTGSDIRPIAQKIQEMLPADARRKVGRLLVVIAAATNGIDRSERASLRKAFRAMDLPAELLEETIREVAPEASEAEVSVKPAAASLRSGEVIPTAPLAHGFRLNHEAISVIMSETREVSAMLAAVMGEADAEAGRSAAEEVGSGGHGTVIATKAAPTIIAAGPAGPYGSLLAALAERDRWTRPEAEATARKFGLMLAAGIETINDWSFDALGGPVIEDEGDELTLDRSILGTHTE